VNTRLFWFSIQCPKEAKGSLWILCLLLKTSPWHHTYWVCIASWSWVSSSVFFALLWKVICGSLLLERTWSFLAMSPMISPGHLLSPLSLLSVWLEVIASDNWCYCRGQVLRCCPPHLTNIINSCVNKWVTWLNSHCSLWQKTIAATPVQPALWSPSCACSHMPYALPELFLNNTDWSEDIWWVYLLSLSTSEYFWELTRELPWWARADGASTLLGSSL
jgi:hypothetical protein